MQMVKPDELARRQQVLMDEIGATVGDEQAKVRRLVSCDGYPYAKRIASTLLKEYECRPPKTDEERVKWEVYTQMKWIIDKTFSTLDQIAATPEPQRKLEKVGPENANIRSSKFNTRPDAGAVARRATRRS